MKTADIKKLLMLGESQNVEFKTTCRADVVDGAGAVQSSFPPVAPVPLSQQKDGRCSGKRQPGKPGQN